VFLYAADGLRLSAWLGPLRYPFVSLMRLWSRLLLGADVTAFPPVAAAAQFFLRALSSGPAGS
jgi:hypothetical protein